MLLKNSCSIHARLFKNSLKHSIRFCGIFPSLKQNFIAYRSSKVSWRPDCTSEIHQLWQSGFFRVYSNSCCSCSLEPEILNISQSSHKMYSNNILNFQESTTNWNACTKKESWRHFVSIKTPALNNINNGNYFWSYHKILKTRRSNWKITKTKFDYLVKGKYKVMFLKILEWYRYGNR